MPTSKGQIWLALYTMSSGDEEPDNELWAKSVFAD